MDKNKALGIISLVFAAFLWSLWGVFSRLLGLGFGIFYQAFSRGLILFLILFACLLLTRSWKRILPTDYKWFLGMSLSELLSVVCFFVAINYLAIGLTLFVFYAASTLGGYFLGSVLFQERLTRIKIISLLISFAGLFVIFSATLEQTNPLYLLLSALSGFGFAGWQVFSKKVSSQYSLIQVMAIDNLIFTLASLIFVLAFKETIILPSFSLVWLILILFAFLVLGASFLNIYGFRRLEAQKGSLIMLSEVVFGVFFGWLFYKEFLTIYSLIGGALILFGAALPNINLEKKSK
ncbi:MAG: DMT family transporter [bacterium]|nr:DMT family transporter [bacterium]